MRAARFARPEISLAVAAPLFALVGIGALIVQTFWLRELRLALGGAASAVSATLVALVLGQAGGAKLGERVALRAASPWRAFGALALAAALGALATPHLLRAATLALDTQYDALLAHPALLVLARGAAALLATLPATLAIGALTPALFAACLGGPRSLASAGTGLYALNALGGALGAALATFSLAERVGLAGGESYGAALLGIPGVIALVSARGPSRANALFPPPPGLPLDEDEDEARRALPLWLLQLAALSGFGTFAAQGLFAQALGRVSNQSAYAFGAVLTVALACIGLGALFTFSLSQRRRPRLALGVSLAIAGGALLVFPAWFVRATAGLAFLATSAPWPAYQWELFALTLATAGSVLLPAACVFPSLIAAATEHCARDGRSAGAAVGRLLLWNAGGALLGALLGPLALVPALGLWGAIALVGAAYLLGSLRPLAEATAPRFGAYAAILGVLLFVVARPASQPALRIPQGEKLLQLEESAAGLVAVFEGEGGRWLQLDNHYALGGARDRVHQERQGHLPLLIHPSPKRVLFLGSATGSSASAALAHRVESITLVEIVPGVARAAKALFASENHGVYANPRTKVVTDDARSFLRASPLKYDVIVGDLFVPWQSGSGALFSVEHFTNAREHLAPGGVFCQWLPLYQLTESEFRVIASSFVDAFADAALFRGDFYGSYPITALCGRAGASEASWQPSDHALPTVSDRWISHPLGRRALFVARLRAADLRDSERETDARPRLEFLAAQSHSGSGVAAPFTGLGWCRFSGALVRRASEVSPDDSLERGGLALQEASALFAAGREDEASAAFSAASQLLPRELVADAPPDPTASELWHPDRD